MISQNSLFVWSPSLWLLIKLSCRCFTDFSHHWGFSPPVLCVCYSIFHHSRWITLCMAFPCPTADSLDPMDHFLSFYVSLIIPKNTWKMLYATFKPISAYIRGFDHYNRVHRDVCIIQILLEFSLTWIRLIRLLAFHMPWDCSDSTLHYPLWSYIRNPLVHWTQIERLKATKL